MTFLKQCIKHIFQYESKLILRKYKPKIIVVAGSVGKTLTRDAIYSVLSKKFFIRKSDRSIASNLSVLLAIIGRPMSGVPTLPKGIKWKEAKVTLELVSWCVLTAFFALRCLLFKVIYPEYLVLEADLDKPGDLRKLAQWLSPDILVLTSIGAIPSHIEFFSTIDHYFAEVKNLISSVKREGSIVYNADSDNTAHLANSALAFTVPCGMAGDCIVRGTPFEILYSAESTGKTPTGMAFKVSSDNIESDIVLFGSIGVHNEYACLLALGVARDLKLNTKDAINALRQFKPIIGRMNIVAGIKDSIIIDDSYNSSPISCEQSIEILSRLSCSGKKIAVIGDMLELGRYSTEEHKKIAHLLAHVSSVCICVGIRSRIIAEEMQSLGLPNNLFGGLAETAIFSVDTAFEAGNILQPLLSPGDIVLIKGSQSMRMERVVLEVMRHPENSSKLLVRQDPEWLTRE